MSYNKSMEKQLIRVKYNEKRLNFLDATLPYLVLTDGSVLYNFDYYSTKTATFIRALSEYDTPIVPFKLWNFKGEDRTTYHNHVEYIEYDKNVIYEAAKEVYDDQNEEFWLAEVDNHYTRLLEMDEDICEARKDIEETYAAEKKELDRRQDLLQKISSMTADDPDALPSPEVMQLRMDESQKILESAFAEPEKSEIIVETPKIITSLTDNTPTKLVL